MRARAAVADNASYTFTDGTGTLQTAYFLDQCDSHSNGMTWHAHGNPNCVTSQVDTGTGPSHIIGIALDGFPIYGGRDVNGNIDQPRRNWTRVTASPALRRSFPRARTTMCCPSA